jgi:ribonuclease BN (tRNA processing enzyme)
MRLTVIGCGPAQPQPDTPASGLLVESGDTAVLLDCGPGVMGRLAGLRDPRSLSAVVIGHLHADHSLDLVALRYLYPWAGGVSQPMRVAIPPGGTVRLTALTAAISERPTFLAEAFELVEYDPAVPLRIGELELRFVPARHYVPAWGVVVRDPAGARLLYSGDTGPNDDLAVAAAGADLLVCEATLGLVDEDGPDRGHLTADEAIALASAARPRATLLTHYPSDRRAALVRAAARAPVPVAVARPGMALAIDAPVPGEAAHRSGDTVQLSPST